MVINKLYQLKERKLPQSFIVITIRDYIKNTYQATTIETSNKCTQVFVNPLLNTPRVQILSKVALILIEFVLRK